MFHKNIGLKKPQQISDQGIGFEKVINPNGGGRLIVPASFSDSYQSKLMEKPTSTILNLKFRCVAWVRYQWFKCYTILIESSLTTMFIAATSFIFKQSSSNNENITLLEYREIPKTK